MDNSHVKIVCFQNEEKQEFEVLKKAILLSKTLKNLLEDTASSGEEIPIKNIRPEVMEKVIRYCTFHTEKQIDSEGDTWDKSFIKLLPDQMLFECTLAANFLEIDPLLDLCCRAIADKIRGKTTEEIRKYFGIKNDFSPEEEEQIKRENEWLLDN